MNKCDFCEYCSQSGRCQRPYNSHDGSSCGDAVKAFQRYLSQQNSNRNVRTKNVNVNVKKRKY